MEREESGISQARWLMEEKAKSELIWVWLRPITPPRSALVILKRITIFKGGVNIRVRRESGAIFCQVVRARQIGQEESLITAGNQKCAGAAPSFMRIDKDIREGESLDMRLK